MTTETHAPTKMIHLTIDGTTLTVPQGTTVYQAAKQLHIHIPIFCYQDRMPPFGACRVCLVEVEKSPKLLASCTLEATEGMVVQTQSELARKGREGILELLLINHPLDCPICDRGGECPLQDNAIAHGPGASQFYEEKRHFMKPLSLGPVLMLDRERCIVCARCTRFGDLVAGDHALEFIERGFKTEVGTPDGGPAQSKFIGNTIMICPVGALTSRVYRFRARPWDNEPAATTCTLCPVGCHMILDSRDGEIVRTRSQENRDLNDIWLCDKGWFGYEFTSHPARLTQPLIRRGSELKSATWEEALHLIAEKIRLYKPAGKLAAFGGNPLTTEECYLLQKLMRSVAGVNHVDHRIGMSIFHLAEEGIPAGMEISIGQCAQLSYAALIGLDITEEFPIVWLRLKHALNHGAQVHFLGHFAPEVAPHLTQVTVHTPGDELVLLKKTLEELAALDRDGHSGALLVGRQYLASKQRRAILAQLREFQRSHPRVSLNLLEGRGNSTGARIAGMHPELGPLGDRLSSPGLDALQVVHRASREGWDYLHIAGANPALKFSKKLWHEARAKLNFLVVQDLFLTATAQQADVVLPVLNFAEKSGSFVNIEGRVQRLQPGKAIPADLYSDGDILQQIAERMSLSLQLDTRFAEALKAPRMSFPKLQTVADGTPAPATHEGALRATLAPALFDQGVRMQHNPRTGQLSQEPRARIHPFEATKRGLQNGDLVRLYVDQGAAIQTTIRLDTKVADRTIVLPLGYAELPVHELSVNLLNGFAIQIEKL